MKDSKTHITKLITNALIIGKTYQSGNIVHIEKPYECIPTEGGLQLIPYDEHILGKKLDQISISNNNIVYTVEPGQDTANAYLSAISGIVPEPKKDIIF